MSVQTQIDRLKNAKLSIKTAIEEKGVVVPSAAKLDEMSALISEIVGTSTPYAVIGSMYPSGSTCICTSDSTTLTAKDTSGKAMFVIPSSGIWTVTATDGTNTKSQDISIIEEGQVEKVTLTYWNGELYDMGNQYTEVTGGWVGKGHVGTVTFNEDSIHIETLDAYSKGVVNTTNAVDLTDFAILNVTVQGSSKIGEVLVYTKDTTGKEIVAAKVSLKGGTNESVTSLDVSALSGAYYVRIQSSGFSSSYYITGSFNVTKVKLETAAA